MCGLVYVRKFVGMVQCTELYSWLVVPFDSVGKSSDAPAKVFAESRPLLKNLEVQSGVCTHVYVWGPGIFVDISHVLCESETITHARIP